MDQSAKSTPSEMSIEATIIRLDGSRQPLGTISYWHRNPLKRLLFKIKKGLGLKT